MKNILIIDCNAIGYMAMHTMGGLFYKEYKTGVIYGFLKAVLSYAEKFDTNRFVFCWDSQRRFRQLVYPDYKMGRVRSLDEDAMFKRRVAHEQFAILREEVLPEMGFKNILYMSGYESDDLLAYYVKKHSMQVKTSYRPIMITGDNDMFQCLNHCDIYHLYRKKILTAEDFESEFDIPVSSWVSAKCLGGCSSDGVPGIDGVSDPAKAKTSKALAYIKGELKKGAILDRIESDKGKRIIRRNRLLIKLPYNGPTPKKRRRIQDLKISFRNNESFDRKAFLNVFDKYRFISFIRGFSKWKEAFDL